MKHLIVTSMLLFSVGFAQDTHMGMQNMNCMQMMQPPNMQMMNLTDKDHTQAFLIKMVAHHQGAIDMAEMEVKMGNDPTVKTWARQIIAAQQKEIVLIQKLLTTQDGMDGGMANQMKSMTHMPEMKSMDPDKRFVRMMISHHVCAIQMASMALEKSVNFEVLKLAQNIVKTQSLEIIDFKIWLAEH